jgi:hypothetical protein
MLEMEDSETTNLNTTLIDLKTFRYMMVLFTLLQEENGMEAMNTPQPNLTPMENTIQLMVNLKSELKCQRVRACGLPSGC